MANVPPGQPGEPAYPPNAVPPPYGSLDQQGYPPPQQGYPPPQQQGYPPQGAPPQQGYPPQGAPPQQGYPPQGAPPQQGYPPQQPGGPETVYPPPQQGQAAPQTVVNQPATVVVAQIGPTIFGDNPVAIQCPNCHNNVTSVVTREMGLLVWLIAGILCLFALWPCCLIPFCITDLYDTKHTCPVCQWHLGNCRKM